MPPLISVMMPCYNSASTLPLALASLVAQTHQDWECMLVDDGSEDDPRAVVEAFKDPRVRYHRFPANRGRPAARQFALEQCRGEYLCMLDADDWYFPEKLQRQLEIMREDPRLALLSTGMSVVDATGEIVGTRATRAGQREVYTTALFSRLAMPPVAHAPCMIRAEVAQLQRYDPAIVLAEDVDFVLRVLLGKCYAVLNRSYYVYTEIRSISKAKILLGHRYQRRMFAKHQTYYPMSARLNIWGSHAKALAYRFLFFAGLEEKVIRARCRPPSCAEREQFNSARATVFQTLSRIAPQLVVSDVNPHSPFRSTATSVLQGEAW